MPVPPSPRNTSTPVSPRPAITQPSRAIKAELNGFYLGLWASGADFPPGSAEYDGYLGYRGEADKFSYDLGLTQVRYHASGVWPNSAALEIGVPVSDKLALSVRDSHDFKNDWNLISLKGEFAVTDAVSVTALIGHDQGLGGKWGELGTSFALNNSTSPNLMAQKNEFSPAVFATSISFDTQLLGN